MKISVDFSQTVHISRDKMVEITLETLKRVYNIPNDSYINSEGYLEEWYNTHGSGYTEKIRKATAEDKIFFKVKDKIMKKKDI